MSGVSIILPTYNRARFLPDALDSICNQTFADWELIIVDDGSTDATEALVAEWIPRLGNRAHYVKQQNRGAYGARNTGLDHVTREYVAFFDSDDLWLPHHLSNCVAALDDVRDVDWVYAACRCVDPNGAVVQPTTFELATGPRPFRHLKVRTVGNLNVVDDSEVVACQLTHGLYAGLQNSVIRRGVFEGHRFYEDSRVVDDVMFLVRALVRGVRIGYLSDVHVIYRIHDDNSSGSSTASNRSSLARIRNESIVGLERLDRDLPLTASQRAALRRTLGRHYFWDLGYVCYWQGGERTKAFEAFKRGLKLNPTDARMWKTYAVSVLRAWLSPQSAG
ncbi:MAG TPA: glycosyltransferase [Vicinamibacterales bacterium]|nr:glycosyltransferase [Vicinamibacterales bacterium]